MRKIIAIVAFMALFMCSCGELIRQERVLKERQILTTERAKVQFMVQKYQNMGINVKDIYVDTCVMEYEESNTSPYWGYLKTVWTIDNSSDEDIFSDNKTERRSVYIEMERNYDEGNFAYKALWPETNPFEK